MITTRAIVLSSVKFQDTSLIVRCYTLEGVRSYLLKGIFKHKKNGLKPAYFEPLTQLEIIATDKNNGKLEYIKEAKVYYHYTLHQNIIKKTVLFFLSEISYMVLNEEFANEKLFYFIEESLQWYDKTEYFANFHLKFLVDLTYFIGIFPNTSNMENPFFDLEEGIFVSENNGHFLFSEEDSEVLKYFLTHSLEDSCILKMNKIQRNKLLEQMIKYYLWHIPTFKVPKCWEVLRTIL
ncbi:MAG: recombination protein O N-terminal domain-containing protein [Capnocytophaga sp.]|nr:recombination protein O N-terminal domain-containing protein [Capnocytophaga sp.]